MPAVQFRDPNDCKVTVTDAKGAILFAADVMEINALMAEAQRQPGALQDGGWLQHMSLSLQRKYGLAEPPAPYNCNQLAIRVADTIKSLKNVDGSTPTSSTATASTPNDSTPSEDSNSNSTSPASSLDVKSASDTQQAS
jgi:hypothetical protein